jgi:hypothetical protein
LGLEDLYGIARESGELIIAILAQRKAIDIGITNPQFIIKVELGSAESA